MQNGLHRLCTFFFHFLSLLRGKGHEIESTRIKAHHPFKKSTHKDEALSQKKGKRSINRLVATTHAYMHLAHNPLKRV